jgi:hypothetical protein
MEAYKKQTQKVVERFLNRKLTFPECISAQDAALARFIRRMRQEELPALRVVLLANNEKVMKEMEKRERNRLRLRERYRQSKLKKP